MFFCLWSVILNFSYEFSLRWSLGLILIYILVVFLGIIERILNGELNMVYINN